MSVRFFSNPDDTVAVVFDRASDWALGPVFRSNDRCFSAKMLAATFIKWARLHWRTAADDWSPEWMKQKQLEFLALDWQDCPKCGLSIVQAGVAMCEDCFQSCDWCGETEVETYQVTGYPKARFCAECATLKRTGSKTTPADVQICRLFRNGDSK